ncbi:MAG: hypothetical protein HZB55_07160 [Deltaproteobacteria bacterium]|nr:hypothetical protein [Deltaproteobacteria bacterium]
MISQPMATCKSAGERFFRYYHRYCVAPDIDVLFELLNAIHSLNDKLQKATSENFFACPEFTALKALRNLLHHEAELIHEVRPLSVADLPIMSDVLSLCLVPRSLVERAIEQLDKKRRSQDEEAIRSTLKWYAEVVNINPCIFNFAVHAFEKLRGLEIDLDGEEYAEFERSYQFEEDTGHSHYISGDIRCHAGDVDAVLNSAFRKIT